MTEEEAQRLESIIENLTRARARFAGYNMDSDVETHPVGTAAKIADMQVRLLKAEGKLAEIGRMLDSYRYKAGPIPSYFDLLKIIDGQ